MSGRRTAIEIDIQSWIPQVLSEAAKGHVEMCADIGGIPAGIKHPERRFHRLVDAIIEIRTLVHA